MSDVAMSLSDLNRWQPKEDQYDELDLCVHDLFKYHAWTPTKVEQGTHVRDSLAEAYKEILKNVPACPTRTRALNMILDARMLANQAITFDGRI